FLLFVLIMASLLGGPAVLVDWLRKRRREAVMQQILLTDKIYAEYGAIASPEVKRPLWGPRKIEFQVGPGAIAKVLAATHEVLSMADRMKLGRYQIILTPILGRVCEEEKAPVRQSTKSWHGDTIVATR
ncbi:MAG TPA: hypothetical protein VN648_14370, partial [Candidatus Methylomirabilis sp.]|nr:hypothetical protein [Candidatus Methylomirabilis sp.]